MKYGNQQDGGGRQGPADVDEMLQYRFKRVMATLVFLADGQIETRLDLIRALQIENRRLLLQRTGAGMSRNNGLMSFPRSAGRD